MATRRYTNSLEAAEQQVGQDVSIDMPVSGSLDSMRRPDRELESDVLIVGADGLDNSYAAQLAFLEEPVEIMVHETTDPNEHNLVEVYCNGVPQFFRRGEVQAVKRKYVEILARAKQTSIQTKTLNTDSDVINRIDRHTALRHPFSVVSDRNPRGAAWLKSVLAAA